MNRETCQHCGSPVRPCYCDMENASSAIGKALADRWAEGFLEELDKQLEKRVDGDSKVTSVLIFPNGNVAAFGNGNQISALQNKSIIEVFVQYAETLNYDTEGAEIGFGNDVYEVKKGKVVWREAR